MTGVWLCLCRKNTFNGILYKNDWAIFAWNLFNEPRCPASQLSTPCTSRITNWGNAMYAYGKSKNKKQLVRIEFQIPQIRQRFDSAGGFLQVFLADAGLQDSMQAVDHIGA